MMRRRMSSALEFNNCCFTLNITQRNELLYLSNCVVFLYQALKNMGAILRGAGLDFHNGEYQYSPS